MLNTIFAIGSILILIISLAGFLGKDVKIFTGLTKIIETKKILLASLVAFGALLGSLAYSIGVGYEPCTLCWWQRIFIYPIFVLGFISIVFKKPIETIYFWALAILGMVFALYHNFIDITGASPLPCGASGPSCTLRYVYEFGFMTIPMMSLMLIASIMLILATKNKNS